MTSTDNLPYEKPRAQTGLEACRTIDAHNLFRGEREICIEHEGIRYRLRITRRNKLILQK